MNKYIEEFRKKFKCTNKHCSAHISDYVCGAEHEVEQLLSDSLDQVRRETIESCRQIAVKTMGKHNVTGMGDMFRLLDELSKEKDTNDEYLEREVIKEMIKENK